MLSMYTLYRLTTTFTPNMRKTSSNCTVKEVQPWFVVPGLEINFFAQETAGD